MRILTIVMAAAVSLSATTALAAEGVGEAMAVSDTASVSGESGERTLAIGSKVFVGDLVATDADGSAQILFADGTRMVVGANSSLMIDEVLFGGNATEKTTDNRFAVNALVGKFRFISGDSGDRGYSIRTPSARIDVRGTAFDFTVTPEGETKLLHLRGETKLCSEDGENGEDEDCATVVTPCALVQTKPGEDVEEIEPGKRRDKETREHFPLVTSDDSLLEEFQVAGHGCADGGLADGALARSSIPTEAIVVGAAAIILCVVFCDFSPESNNNTN